MKKSTINFLLACGIIYSVIWVGTDIIAALSFSGYSYSDHAISELSALGSVSRPYVVAFLAAACLFSIAFGIGIRNLTEAHKNLRIVGALMVIYGIIGLISFFFPMNMRGVERSFTDTMHLAFGGVAVLLIILSIIFASLTRGTIFRIYSAVSILTLIIFGILTGLQSPNMSTGYTPGMGILERISAYTPMLWILVLAIILLRTEKKDTEIKMKNL